MSTEYSLSVPAPKEVVDVLAAADALVAKIVAGEAPGQIASEELQTLINLYQELGALPAEVSTETDECLDAAALFGRRIAFRLLKKPVVPVDVVKPL